MVKVLSVILPVKDEPYLEQLLVELRSCLKPPYEILIQREKGLGYAVMCGINKAKGDVIVVCDADGSHPVTAIMPMVNLISKWDIIVGSRYSGGATNDSLVRQLISRVYCLFAQVLFWLNIRDNMSGFVVAKKEVFMVYPIGNKGFKFNLENLVKTKGVFKATEYPIVFEKRKAGKSKASPMEALHTLLFIFRLRMQF